MTPLDVCQRNPFALTDLYDFFMRYGEWTYHIAVLLLAHFSIIPGNFKGLNTGVNNRVQTGRLFCKHNVQRTGTCVMARRHGSPRLLGLEQVFDMHPLRLDDFPQPGAVLISCSVDHVLRQLDPVAPESCFQVFDVADAVLVDPVRQALPYSVVYRIQIRVVWRPHVGSTSSGILRFR